jgi:inner membrane protein
MQKALVIKLLSIFVVSLILVVLISMVKTKVYERQQFQQQAQITTAQSWTSKQRVLTPVLILPFTTSVQLKSGSFDSHHLQTQNDFRYLMPEQLLVRVATTNSTLSKGIYPIPVYQADISLSGHFSTEKINKIITDIKNTQHFNNLKTPYLTFQVSDSRGIRHPPQLNINGDSSEIELHDNVNGFNNGLHSKVYDIKADADLEFDLELTLPGMEQLSIVPLAYQSRFTLSSNWPHPEFTGAALPVERSINDDGFKARWSSTHLSGRYDSALKQCLHGTHCDPLNAKAIGVRFIEPVDIYQQSERAIKYAILFIGLSFITFFIFEVIKQVPIHPIQYTFVGLAIATFYLLLLSLAEHISFSWAYGISTLACCSLMLYYVRHVLNGMQSAILFTGMMLALYGVLFVIIQAEDLAQLMGAILVFSILATLMIVTRKLDWYSMTYFDGTDQ